MRNTSSSIRHVLLAVALAALCAPLVACGGKIAPSGDPNGTGDPAASSSGAGATAAASPSPSPSDQASPPVAPLPPSSSSSASGGLTQAPGGPSVDDACAAICARNGTCGADQTDCNDTCRNEINSALSCGPEGYAYIQCYANNLVGCSALPPVCESAYCAYTICAGKVVPDYCH